MEPREILQEVATLMKKPVDDVPVAIDNLVQDIEDNKEIIKKLKAQLKEMGWK